MVEWFRVVDFNAVMLGSNPALATCCWFNSLAILVNSQVVCLPPVLNCVCVSEISTQRYSKI